MVTRDDSRERSPGQKVHDLSEQGLAGMHRSLQKSGSRKSVRNGISSSNRHHPYSMITQ
jgi:hypothetical protein